MLLYRFGDCAHYPAGIAILAQVAHLCIFFIICLVFAILLIVGTCKIAQTVSNSIHQLLKRFCRNPGCRTHLFSTSHIFLHLHDCCSCVLNLLSSHSGLSIHIILDAFLFLLIALNVCFSSFLHQKLLFRLEAVQCSQRWDSFDLQATLGVHLLDYLLSWMASSICCISPPEVAQCLFSEPWPLYLESTSLLGEILEVSRYGPHGGKLCHLCQGCYIWSPWRKRNVCFNRHLFRNSNDNHITWLHH